MISIIVPIYKVEDYLRRCVDSLLAQTCRDFELILVDDGSPDSCGIICDAYVAQDARIKVIHKENGGLSDARNAGMAIAKGEYIAFVDSDDWVSPDYLERLLNGMLQSGADICECNVLPTEGEVANGSVSTTHPQSFSTQDAMLQLIHDGTFRQHVWNKLYRREVIGDILFPKGKTNEDEFWTYQVFGNASRMAKIDDVLYYYFHRPGSIMQSGYSLKRLDALEAKCLRQGYIQQRFPELASVAKVNLIASAIYSGQMTLLHLKGRDLQTAKSTIGQIIRAYPLEQEDYSLVSGSARMWLRLTSLSFWGTCRLKNLLKRGF